MRTLNSNTKRGRKQEWAGGSGTAMQSQEEQQPIPEGALELGERRSSIQSWNQKGRALMPFRKSVSENRFPWEEL